MSNNAVNAETLLAIERELREPLFLGVPIGSTLGELYAGLLLGTAPPGIRSVVRDVSTFGYRSLFGVGSKGGKITAGAGKFLFTWLDDRPHLTDLVLPAVDSLGANECVVLGRTNSMQSKLPTGAEFLSWDALPPVDLGKWQREYEACASIWHRKVFRWARAHGVSMRMLPRFGAALVVQSQMVVVFTELLKRLSPLTIITEYDRDHFASGLVLAARTMGIPTVTMIHGCINSSYGYTPLLADEALCWGKRHFDQLVALGAKPEQLLITGCQRLRLHAPASPAGVSRKLGLSGKPLVLLATNPIQLVERLELARSFCRAVTGHDDVQGAVRLHPSERLIEYIELISEFPAVRFLANNECGLEEILAATDTVVCHNSGFGNDALVAGRPVIVLDVTKTSWGNSLELAREAGCPVATNSEELWSLLERVIWDAPYREVTRAKAQRYVREFCSSFGLEAAISVAQAIRNTQAIV